MSSGLATPPQSALPTPVAAPPSACEGFIDQRLRKTRRRVKAIDIATGLVVLTIGVLAYLLAAALIDHWLIVGGLGAWGRFLLWFGLVAAAGTYFASRLLPPLLHRINPVFAAATIEKSQPTLKNSLINFLLLRGRRQEVAAPVYRAMESRAAADLSHIEIEVAVDRTRLVRLGCVLLAIVALFSFYLLVSPKNPLRSAARVLFPWSTIEAPTRVTIHNVRPGTGTFFHGESIPISANVAGLRDGEPLRLVYSTSDGQIADQEIPMTPTEDGLRYECRFPPGSLGLQQDYEYYLSGGDCQSPRYHITVQTAPAIVVESVDYRYPAYTGIAKRTAQRQGDLSAIEGTEVTLHATSNTEIKPDSAEIDLGCTGRPGVRMTSDGKTATGHFTLRLMDGDPSRPSYDCYQLRFTDMEGHENQRPIRYHIDVSRDLPPNVQLLDPSQEKTQVAENGKLAIKVQADDDYGLHRVSVRAERDGRSLLLAPLLDKKNNEKPWPNKFAGTCSFEPAKLGLKAGDSVQYWAEAEDNMEPVCHRTASDKRWIEVVGLDRKPSPEERPDAAKDNPGQPGDKKKASNGAAKSADNKAQPGDAKPPDKNDDQGKPADKNDDQGKSPDKNNDQGSKKTDAANGGADQRQKADQSSDKPTERIDSKTDPGDAIQEILKDREKEQQEQQSQNRKNQQRKDGQSGDQKDQSKKGAGEQGDQKQQGGDQKDQSQKGGSDKNGQKQSPGTGKSTGGGTPSPQDANVDRKKKPGVPGETSDKHENQDAKSPSISPHQSDSQGNTTGDKSGGGESGGGQRADKQGVGSAGSHTPGDDGGSKANEPGAGEVGNRSGDKTASKDSGGNEKPGTGGHVGEGGKKSDDKADGQQKTSPSQTDSSDKPGTPQENPANGGTPSNGTSEGPKAHSSNGPPGGGVPGARTDEAHSAEPTESPADQANLKYARQQTELALEHLRDQLAKEKPPLLDRLGWTKDEAQRFLERWEAMKRAAAESGPEGDAARKKFADAIQSLGLSPRSAELRRGGVAPDRPQELRDRGRFATPADWDEQFRAYTRGISGGNRPEKQDDK